MLGSALLGWKASEIAASLNVNKLCFCAVFPDVLMLKGRHIVICRITAARYLKAANLSCQGCAEKSIWQLRNRSQMSNLLQEEQFQKTKSQQ